MCLNFMNVIYLFIHLFRISTFVHYMFLITKYNTINLFYLPVIGIFIRNSIYLEYSQMFRVSFLCV